MTSLIPAPHSTKNVRGFEVQGCVNGVSAVVLIDTGSAVTLISETLAGRVGVGPDDIEGYEGGGLCSANGSPLWGGW